MKANFVGRVENNHTAFIRIKTNQEQMNNLVILPVEVEVSSGKKKKLMSFLKGYRHRFRGIFLMPFFIIMVFLIGT
jgi:hypothetical protein